MQRNHFMKKISIAISVLLTAMQFNIVLPQNMRTNAYAASADYTWNNVIPEKFPVPANKNGKLVLFDNSHGETTGQADWVIDGGFSDFADDLVSHGYTVKEYRGVDKNGDGSIRYYDDRKPENVDKNEAIITYDAIKDADVFVMAEVNRPFTIAEQDALKKFVVSGKGIYFIADHYNADRNMNTWDATETYNGYNRSTNASYNLGGVYGDLRNPQDATKGWLAQNFGLRFRFNAIDLTSGFTGVKPASETEGLTTGVKPILMAAGSTLAIVDGSKAKGIVYLGATDKPAKWSSAADKGLYFGGEAEGAYVAISKPSKGKAAFIGDSSPIEDITPKYKNEGTGKAKSTHNGYKDAGNAAVLSVNIINWLANPEDYVGFDGVNHTKGINTPTPLADIEKTESQAEPWATPTYDPWNTDTFATGSYNAPQGTAAAIVNVTGVSIVQSAVALSPGSTQVLTAVVAPTNATNTAITWSSSDENIATVSNGIVTAKAEGTAVITVTTIDGLKTAKCNVLVTNAQITSTISEGFGGVTGTSSAISSGIPSGWNFTSGMAIYNTTGNYGAASPSIKMQGSGNQITTPTFALTAKGILSFWVKGQSTDSNSDLLVERFDGTNWTTVEDIKPLPTNAVTKTYSLAQNTKQIRFTYTKSAGNLALDDINVTQEATIPQTPKTISIVGTSDLHGAIYPLDYNTGLAANVGLARVSTYVNNLRSANPYTMLIDNGDTIQGTPLVYYYNMIDQDSEYPMMKVMGAMGYDAWTLGNHEFNYGLTTLNRIISDANKNNIAVLSANTYKTTDNSNFVNPYYTKTFDVNGKSIKVGILGLTTKCIPNWEDPAHYAGLEFKDLVDEAQKWTQVLKNQEDCDIVIASMHSGVSSPSDTIPENQVDAVATHVSGIDAILAGHTHTGVTYSFTNPDGNTIPVVEPKNGDGIISQIDINIDGDGNITGVAGNDVTLPADTIPDKAILDLAKPYQDATITYTNTVIGKSTAVFEGAKQLAEPSTIMELVNKVQMSAAASQLSIAAPLSLASKIPQGDIKRQDIMGVYVYENFLYGVNMTGKQLKNWLEWSARYYKQVSSPTDPIVKDPMLNIADYNLDQLYGATYDIDITQPACTTDSKGLVISGNRIKNLKVNGVPVKDADVFKVAINNYRYNGGGGFMAAAGLAPGSDATIAATYYDSAKALGDDGQVRNMMFKYVEDNNSISPTNSNNWKISTTPIDLVEDPLQLVINYDKKIIEVGDNTTVTISAKAAKSIYAFDVYFKYDNTLFDFVSVVAKDEFSLGNSGIVQDNNGNIRIIGVLKGSQKGLEGDMDLLTVKLKARNKDAIASSKIVSGSKLSDENSKLYTLNSDIEKTIVIANSDINGIGGTGLDDLVMVSKAFGKKSEDSGYLTSLDMNKDGVINIIDLTYVVIRMLMVK